MVGKFLALGVLTVSLAASGVHAQTATPGAAAPSTNAVDPASVQVLKDMGAYLQTLKRFQVSTELTGERVLADGQDAAHGDGGHGRRASEQDTRGDEKRPFRARDHLRRQDGYAVHAGGQKDYSAVEFTETIGGLIDRLESRFGVEMPLSDLFLFGTPAAPLDKLESAMNAGQDFVGDDLCDHYAYRQGKVDWQIWITTGSKPPAAQDRDHQSCRRRTTAVGFDDRVEPEAGVQGRGIQVHAAQGRAKIEIVPRKTQ